MSKTVVTDLRNTGLTTPREEDVKAIRASAPGIWLGRTTALLGVLAAVLAAAKQAGDRLADIIGVPASDDRLIRSIVFFGAGLVVCVQLVQEWRARRDLRKATELAVKIDAVPSGFFRIGPYRDTNDDRAQFDRADRAHEKVLSWIRDATITPLFLSGDSGAGKTSLLNASVLPNLRAAGWDVLEARVFQDPAVTLRSALAPLSTVKRPSAGEPPTLRTLIELAAKRAKVRLLIVLDQFEEFVILTEPAQRKVFLDLITELQSKQIKNFNLLLVLRSDYDTTLDDLGLPRLRLGENYMKVGRFVLAAAKRFIEHSGLAMRSESLDQLLSSAAELDDSPGMVRPITLNVLGTVLSDGLGRAPSVNAGALVTGYFEQVVEQQGIRDRSPKVLREMVTDQATKRPRSEQELMTATSLRLGEVRAVLGGLAAAGLARPLDPGQGVWELSHDFVARIAFRYLGRLRAAWWRNAAAYAGPALFVTVIGAGVITVLLDRAVVNQARIDLVGKGWAVTDSSDGYLTLRAPGSCDQSYLDQSKDVLSRLSNSAHAVEIDDCLELSNLSPLSPLTSLLSLKLSRDLGRAVSVEAVKHMTALKQLDLDGTSVADLAPLANLVELKRLDLSGDLAVQSLPKKHHLTALSYLSLSVTKIADIRPITGMTKLTSLDLRDDWAIKDFSPLDGSVTLTFLWLGETKFEDAAILKRLINLRFVDLNGSQVDDIEPLENLPMLSKLCIGAAKIKAAELERFAEYRAKKGLPTVTISNCGGAFSSGI